MEKRQVSPDEVRQILSDHDLWVKTNHESGQQADFTNCDLRGFDFCSPNEIHPFHSMIFRGADLSGVSMERLHFKDCDFTGAKMNQVAILKVCFENCDLSKANLSLARISTTLMLDNQFYETRFSKSKFIACEFEGNAFHKASLDNIDTVKQCKMSGNRFFDMNPVYANLSDTEFFDNKFSHVAFIQCVFDHSRFKRCQFIQSGFLDSYVEKCRFEQTEMQNRFMQVQIMPPQRDTVHITCDLGLRTIMSRDLFKDEKVSMRLDDFIKGISAERDMDRAVKEFLITLGKTFQEACNNYKKNNDHIR